MLIAPESIPFKKLIMANSEAMLFAFGPIGSLVGMRVGMRVGLFVGLRVGCL